MASILKVTTTINIESDILGKEAGQLVKDLATAVMPAIVKSVNDYLVEPAETKKETK